MSSTRHPNKGKPKLDRSASPSDHPTDETNNLPEQTVTPIPTTLILQVQSEQVSTISREYQMTIRTRRRLDRHQVSMILMVLICKVVKIGIDFSGALTMDFLYLNLLGSKTEPTEIRDEKERRTAMLAQLLIAYQRGTWLSFSDRERLPLPVIQKIKETGWLPNDRTLKSWEPWWRPESFLELRFVRLDSLIERETDTERYSGYTKGYGNGGHISRVKKTRLDFEIDGEETDRPEVEIPLVDIDTYNQILLAVESAKALKRFK